MNILKNSSIYILVSVFSGSLSFLLLPILTDHLNPEDYGIYEVYRSLISLLQGFMIFGTNTLIFGNYFKWSKKDLKIFLHNSIFIFLMLLVILSSLSLIPEINSYFFNNFSIPLSIVLAGIFTVFFQSVTSLQTTIFQIRGKAIKYAFFTAGFSLITFIITYILVVHYSLNWHGPVISILLTSLIFFVFTNFNFLKMGIKVNYPFSKLKLILFLGFPLIFTHISGWIIEAFDKLMITSILSSSATGNYSVNYKFSMIVFLIQIGVLRAWAPLFYKTISLNTTENNIKIVQYTYILILFLLLITCFVIFVSPYLFSMFIKGDSYNFSIRIIVYVSIGYFFDGLWKIFGQYLINLNKIKIYSIILAVSAISNLILNYFLIKKYGIDGAAISTCFAFFIGFVLTFAAASYYNPMPWFYLNRK
jgi:O-antigen/teichoic acid export membrane protein